MIHRASLVHQIDGRLRIRVPLARNDREYFARVRELFGHMQGIQTVETNYLTGSILLLHSTDPQEIEKAAARAGLFMIDRGSQPLAASTLIEEKFSSLQARLSHFSRSRIDFQGAALLLLLGGGVVQGLRKRILPPVVTLLWYAATLLKESKSSLPANPTLGTAQPPRDYVQ
jgi:hypothetical protein